MSAKQTALSLVAIVIILSGLSACGTVQDSQVSQVSSGSAERLRQEQLRNTTASILKNSAENILKCFHPSQAFIDVSVDQVNSNGNVGTATGNIFMRGFVNRYNMAVTLTYDSSDDTVRVQPGISNTIFAAKADCALRSWGQVDHIGLAARQAVNEFHAQVVGAVAIGVAASAASGSRSSSSSSPQSSYSSSSASSPSSYDLQRLHDQLCNQCSAKRQSDRSRCRGLSDKGFFFGTWGAYSLSEQGKCMADAEKSYDSCKAGC